MSSYYAVVRSGELQHFGIKGMKWGVWNEETRARRTGSGRKSKTQIRKENSIKRKDKRERIKREQDIKRIRSMSDAELKEKLERINTEIKYRDAMNRDLHPARTAVSDFMKQNGRKVLGVAAVAGGVIGLKKLGNKAGISLTKQDLEMMKKVGRYITEVAKEMKVPKPK